MGLQRIDFRHLQAWTITENNAVGPTTSLTLRTLDNGSPSDTNAVYLAMNGSDAGADGNAGTGISSAPVLTLEKAYNVVQAQPTRNTIHVIRNGYVGSLSFLLTAVHAGADVLPANSIIQVELGETAIITFTNAGAGNAAIIQQVNGLKINGFYIYFSNDQITGFNPINFISAQPLLFKWCYLETTVDNVNNVTYIEGAANNTLINNSIFNGKGYKNSTNNPSNAIKIGTGLTGCQVNNCIFYNYAKNETNTKGVIQAPCTVNHSSFYNISSCFYENFTGDIITVTNSIFDKVTYYNAPNNSALTYSISNSLVNVINRTANSLQTLTETDNIDNVIALFYDPENADLRLQDARRLAPNSIENFVFTSRAVYNPDLGYTIATDSKDLGVYDVSYTQTLDAWTSLEWDNEFFNDKIQIETELMDYQGFSDIRGNFHRVFNTPRRKINFGIMNENWTGTSESYKLLDLITASGAKRWYPNGDTGLFTNTSKTLTANADDSWSLTVTTSPTLINNSFRGFVCLLASGANNFYLRIREHSGAALILEDHRETQNTLTAGTYNITCLYLPIEVDQSNTGMSFDNWDPQNNPLMIPTTEIEHWEGNVRNLLVRECELDI